MFVEVLGLRMLRLLVQASDRDCCPDAGFVLALAFWNTSYRYLDLFLSIRLGCDFMENASPELTDLCC